MNDKRSVQYYLIMLNQFDSFDDRKKLEVLQNIENALYPELKLPLENLLRKESNEEILFLIRKILDKIDFIFRKTEKSFDNEMISEFFKIFEENEQENGEEIIQRSWIIFSSMSKDSQIKALKHISAKSVRHFKLFLYKILNSPCDDYVVSMAISLLSNFKDEKTIQFIESFLENKDARIRANALEALIKLNPKNIFEIITELLQDSNHRVRANALKGMLNYNPDLAYKGLESMSYSTKLSHRKTALHTVLTLKFKNYHKLLVKFLSDEDSEIRQIALKEIIYLPLSLLKELKNEKLSKTILEFLNELLDYRQANENVSEEKLTEFYMRFFADSFEHKTYVSTYELPHIIKLTDNMQFQSDYKDYKSLVNNLGLFEAKDNIEIFSGKTLIFLGLAIFFPIFLSKNIIFNVILAILFSFIGMMFSTISLKKQLLFVLFIVVSVAIISYMGQKNDKQKRAKSLVMKALSFYKRGQTNKALQYLQRAKSLNKDDTQIKILLDSLLNEIRQKKSLSKNSSP